MCAMAGQAVFQFFIIPDSQGAESDLESLFLYDWQVGQGCKEKHYLL